MENTQDEATKPDVYSLLYARQPICDWENGDELGRITSVTSAHGWLEFEVEFKGGNVAKLDEHSLYRTSYGIVLLPPGIREVNKNLYELGRIWKRIAELDDLFYSGKITEDKLDKQITGLLLESNPLEERMKKDREEFTGVKAKLDEERRRVHEQTLELQARHLLNEVSDAERESILADLRKRSSYVSLRIQVLEAILKKIEEIQTLIRTRTRIDAWRTDGTTAIIIKGTRETDKEQSV